MTRSARGRRGEGSGVGNRATSPQRSESTASSRQGGGSGRLKRLWHAFLYDRSVRSRLGVLVLIPLLGALVLGSFLFKDTVDRSSAAGALERNARATAVALNAMAKLQDERDISGLYETEAAGEGHLADARNQADDALEALRQQMANLPNGDGSAIGEAVRSAEVQLRLLDAYRGSRDIELEPYDIQGVEKYRLVNETLLRFIKATAADSDNSELVSSLDSLDSLARATEAASVERGLLAHVLGSGATELTDAEKQREAILRGEQEFLLNRYASAAEPEIRADYFKEMPTARGPVEEMRNGALADTEGETPMAVDLDGNRYPVTQAAWYEAASARIDVMRGLQETLANAIVRDAASAANATQIRAVVTALAVLLVLALTIVLAYSVARSITRPLRRLRTTAHEAAETGLPALVARIHDDGPAVVRRVGDAVVPEGRDEIGELASAFNAVHSTAVRVAGEQALLRQNLDTIVVNLSRRTQGLVDRQLGEIEDLEARERDPDQLGTLFRIDHLATRVRRHAESLLVLAGVEEMRRQGSAAPVLDVVRTAVGEVEQYPRIKFGVMPTDLVVPSAVDDVAHLLAELLDNATEFSAPSTQVSVTSQPLLGGGLRLQITDSGLGIPPDQLALLNERLRNPGDIDVASSRTLGIYVVARLAARHGATVRLVPAENTSGTIAQVDLPAHLVVSPLDTTDGVIQAIRSTDDPSSTPGQEQQEPEGPQASTPAPTAPSTSEQGWTPEELRPQPQRQPSSSQPSTPPATDRPAPATPTAPAAPTPPATPATPATPTPRETRTTPTADPAVSASDNGTDGALTSRRAPRPSPPSSSQPPAQPASPGGGTPSPRPLQPTSGANGLPAREIARGGESRGPTSPARAQDSQQENATADSPIYEAVKSAWFSKESSLEWSSPADEGWRRAAAALRTAEEAANARKGHREAPEAPARRPSPEPPRPAASRPPATSRTQAAPPAPARPAPSPAAQPPTQPAPQSPTSQSPTLPTRQRGATLIPGSIADTTGDTEQQKAPSKPKDASTVASTLSNLQRGVSRGRAETGGWVPERPSDTERSNQ